jgi:hypothetical protein
MLAFFVFTGCKKDNDLPPVKSLEEVLTSTSWKMEEIRFLQNNTFYYYKRGATGNSLSFDSDVITFNTNKTGTYIGDGTTYPLTWDFTDAGKTKVSIIINYATPLTVTMENISYTNTSLKYTEYYNRNGTNTLASVSRIPL